MQKTLIGVVVYMWVKFASCVFESVGEGRVALSVNA